MNTQVVELVSEVDLFPFGILELLVDDEGTEANDALEAWLGFVDAVKVLADAYGVETPW